MGAEVVDLNAFKSIQPKRVVLFQCISRETGEYCNDYAIEFEFDSKEAALNWLKNKKIKKFDQLSFDDEL